MIEQEGRFCGRFFRRCGNSEAHVGRKLVVRHDTVMQRDHACVELVLAAVRAECQAFGAVGAEHAEIGRVAENRDARGADTGTRITLEAGEAR